MSESNEKYLDTFPNWLRALGADAEEMGELLNVKGMPTDSLEAITGGLNYLFKSLDLIPDGIDDIGYLDDAFVLRVSADLAAQESLSDVAQAHKDTLQKLADDCKLLREFLEGDYDRLEAYVRGLRNGAARGRSVDDIIKDEAIRRDFLGDVQGFAKSYSSPAFGREEKNLIKLRAFFDAKLPK